MASATSLGRVQPLYKGTYSSTTTYQKLDNVYYNGDTWVCISDNVIDIIPIEGSVYWQKVAGRGATGATPNITADATASSLPTGENPTVNVQTTGTAENKYYTFNFGIPAGPIGKTGVQSIEVSATGRKQDDSGDLTANDPPWADASLDSSTQELTMRFGIPPGHDGSGSVSTVDDERPTNGNVALNAVRYSAGQQIDPEHQGYARANINAQVAGNYIDDPAIKDYGTFLQFAGSVSNPSWVASTINQVPSGGSTNYVLRKQINAYGWTPVYEIPAGGDSGSVLVKQSDTDYSYGWSPVITEDDINDIVES